MLFPSSQLVLNLLAGLMLASSFFLVGRMRLLSMLTLFRWQSVFLSAYALTSALVLGEEHLVITALLNLAIKAYYIPRLLAKTAADSAAIHRLSAYVRPATALFVAFLMVLLSLGLTRAFLPSGSGQVFITSVSVAMVMLGLLMLVVRKGLYSQMIGFLMMENGIFTFGLVVTGGMPLLVELGIFFDVIIGSLLMAALSYRVQTEHASTLTDSLTALVDADDV